MAPLSSADTDEHGGYGQNLEPGKYNHFHHPARFKSTRSQWDSAPTATCSGFTLNWKWFAEKVEVEGDRHLIVRNRRSRRRPRYKRRNHFDSPNSRKK